VPRVALLLALAHRCDALLRTGEVANSAVLARLGHVSRARIAQILNLLNLAPIIQEHILFLPLIQHGRDPLHLAQLQPLASTKDWKQQLRLWKELVAATSPRRGPARRAGDPGDRPATNGPSSTSRNGSTA